MKKQGKQRLFEVMSRLDKTFKPKLNENWYGDSNSYGEYIDEIKHFVILIDNGKFDEAKQLLNKFENEGKINGLKSYLKEYGEFEAENWVFDNLGGMSENIYKDDDKTSKAFRDFAKASDPEGHKRRWEKERPGEQEPEPEKPQAMNVMKKDLNERKPVGINPKYTHFALLKDSKKFVNGWDFKGVDPEDLKQDKMHYFFQDIIDMDIDPKNVLIGTVKKFQKEGLDPFDSNNWYKFNADGWQERDDLNEEDINQIKYRAEVTGKGENVWSGNAMEYDTEEEAKQWLDNLSQRWFGYDMGRVVPTTTPKGQPVDLKNDVIYQNFRR